MSVIRILGIPGSIRKASTNLGLLRAAGQLFADTPGVEFAIADISHLPLYNSDLETQAGGAIAFPEAVTAFREQVANADAILFATAEYNYSISTPLKNAIDWASRPPNVWNDKAAAIVGAGGGGGTSRSQYHLRQVGVFVNLHFLNKPEVFVKSFEPPQKFDADGNLVDEATRAQLGTLSTALVEWTRRITHK